MDFLDLAIRRYSCRKYLSTPVEEEKLAKILETIRVAPSAANYQPVHFLIIQLPENKAKVIESYPRDWIKSAPILIVAYGDHNKSWKRNDGKDHLDIDLSIAIDHLTLQATNLGLATCWVCNFNPVILKQHFHLPDNMEPVAIIPLGYPADGPDMNRHATNRLPLEKIVHWEKID